MTNPIIKPTVGRVVWFHPYVNSAEAGFARHQDGQPYAAIVTHVWNGRLVNLSVFDADGVAHSRTSVELVQGYDTVPGNGFYCEWMPYQKGQAAKTEAAEKAAVPAGSEYRQPTQREQLEYLLVQGAAHQLSANPERAANIADGIKNVLNALHPLPVLDNPHTGAPRDPRDVASDPQAILCTKPGEPPKAAPITLPVMDAGPDPLEREIQAYASAGPRVTPADIEGEIAAEFYFTAADGVLGQSEMGTRPAAWTNLDQVTICTLVLRNGAKVLGVNYGAIDRAQHDAGKGREAARAAAVEKIWELLGFRLRDKLAESV